MAQTGDDYPPGCVGHHVADSNRTWLRRPALMTCVIGVAWRCR